jgi:RNA polymerase sigma-70 factor (ECF subfamily)
MEEEAGARIQAPAPIAESDPLPSLVTGAVSGDANATRTLLVTMGRQVRGACRAILGSGHPDLEDTIQECFVGLIRALPAYRFEGAFPHYALRIAVRTALGARRRAQATRAREAPEAAPGDEAPAPSSTPSEQVLTAERRELLRGLLDELPEVQAQSLVMRILFDLSIEEIATASGVSVNTVKTRLRLGKDSLRRRITGDSKLATALGGPR